MRTQIARIIVSVSYKLNPDYWFFCLIITGSSESLNNKHFVEMEQRVNF